MILARHCLELADFGCSSEGACLSCEGLTSQSCLFQELGSIKSKLLGHLIGETSDGCYPCCKGLEISGVLPGTGSSAAATASSFGWPANRYLFRCFGWTSDHIKLSRMGRYLHCDFRFVEDSYHSSLFDL